MFFIRFIYYIGLQKELIFKAEVNIKDIGFGFFVLYILF